MKKKVFLEKDCKKLLFIVNPVAGRKLYKKVFPEMIQEFMEAGYLVTTYLTQSPSDAERYAALCGADYDRVVCLGGDGTFAQVVAGLKQCGKDMPVGYIPAGSSNDFGALHGLSTDLVTAAHDAVTGGVKTVDCGTFNDKLFIYVAAFGAFVATSYVTPQDLKNALGRPAYFLDVMRELPRIKAEHMKVTANGQTFEGNYIFGAITNNTSVSGVVSLPEGTVVTDDGEFEVVLIENLKTLPELGDTVYSVLSGDFISKNITFFHASELTIEADNPIDWTLDGEYHQGDLVVKIENHKQSLKVYVPEAAAPGEPLP
ncbi:MAG: diacylglycerol kinase family lipid kinase [Clostridia bacterium]|nr:diacylglycerol kinase family lipid kinase [Clostridia bacterium]